MQERPERRKATRFKPHSQHEIDQIMGRLEEEEKGLGARPFPSFWATAAGVLAYILLCWVLIFRARQ